MNTFGQVIREARKSVGLIQRAVERLWRGDGRKVLPAVSERSGGEPPPSAGERRNRCSWCCDPA
jgi:hypothetical protein